MAEGVNEISFYEEREEIHIGQRKEVTDEELNEELNLDNTESVANDPSNNRGDEGIMEGTIIKVVEDILVDSDDDDDDFGITIHAGKSNIIRRHDKDERFKSSSIFTSPNGSNIIPDPENDPDFAARKLLNEELKKLRYSHHRTAFDVDIEALESQPWRNKGSDISDYFNYGFTERTWIAYCAEQLKVRMKQGLGPQQQTFQLQLQLQQQLQQQLQLQMQNSSESLTKVENLPTQNNSDVTNNTASSSHSNASSINNPLSKYGPPPPQPSAANINMTPSATTINSTLTPVVSTSAAPPPAVFNPYSPPPPQPPQMMHQLPPHQQPTMAAIGNTSSLSTATNAPPLAQIPLPLPPPPFLFPGATQPYQPPQSQQHQQFPPNMMMEFHGQATVGAPHTFQPPHFHAQQQHHQQQHQHQQFPPPSHHPFSGPGIFHQARSKYLESPSSSAVLPVHNEGDDSGNYYDPANDFNYNNNKRSYDEFNRHDRDQYDPNFRSYDNYNAINSNNPYKKDRDNSRERNNKDKYRKYDDEYKPYHSSTAVTDKPVRDYHHDGRVSDKDRSFKESSTNVNVKESSSRVGDSRDYDKKRKKDDDYSRYTSTATAAAAISGDDKVRDKDRLKDDTQSSSRDKDKERDKERDKHKDRSSSHHHHESSVSTKETSSSSAAAYRSNSRVDRKDRDRSRDKESSSTSKDPKDSTRDREKHKDKDRDRERDRDRDRDQYSKRRSNSRENDNRTKRSR